jgi:Tol biopolymer transport system component
MNPDGSDVVNLTNGREGEDNYHAYWSPDGSRLVWTHVAWDIQNGGQGFFDIRVANYVDDASGPHLADVTVVHPPVPHFIETQWWSPDGTKFLYTESIGNALNLELFLFDTVTGVSRQLTHHPAWDEQAIFTPDGTKVIFMSTRDHPSTWETWAHASWTAHLPTSEDHLLILPLFVGTFFSPVLPPATDLYEVDVNTLATRRLTFDGDDGWIIPEFAWDPTGTKLLWTEQKNRDSIRVSHLENPATDVDELTALPGEPLPASVGLDAFLVARTLIGHYPSAP